MARGSASTTTAPGIYFPEDYTECCSPEASKCCPPDKWFYEIDNTSRYNHDIPNHKTEELVMETVPVDSPANKKKYAPLASMNGSPILDSHSKEESSFRSSSRQQQDKQCNSERRQPSKARTLNPLAAVFALQECPWDQKRALRPSRCMFAPRGSNPPSLRLQLAVVLTQAPGSSHSRRSVADAPLTIPLPFG
ncbi:hypothetical protein MTO96_008105 [Rhipicephalus appendiculatus]